MSQQKLPEKVWFPWADTKPGGGFFIPTLTPEAFAADVVDAALRCGIKASVYVGVHEGKYGLICLRQLPPPEASATEQT
jgi:hypothetical protein